MRRELRRYMTELLLSLLMIVVVISGMIGIRYRSYQSEMERMALILTSDEAQQDVFQILKGDETASESDADTILARYGYTDPEDSEAGRQFLRDSSVILIGGAVSGFVLRGFSDLNDIEKERKEKSRVRILLQSWRRYGRRVWQIISELDAYMEDQSWKRILDELDSLGSYVDMIRSQAHREKEETKSLVTDLSHQLKTPVAALSSCFDILKNPDLSEKNAWNFRTGWNSSFTVWNS